MAFETPIAFMFFNRPQVTAQVFSEIARIRPQKLLLLADGPRADQPGEAALCAQTRAVVEAIDWSCEVYRNFAPHNLGLRERISSGLRWVFETVDRAIILEDDCLPHASFFVFCAQLLEYYKDSPQVMHISGDNFQYGNHQINSSYYFSRYPHIWGWASWRRAWNSYDVSMRGWVTASEEEKNSYLSVFEDENERAFWRKIWDGVAAGTINTWDYQWVFNCVANNGICIVPAQNLVANIGFGVDATNTVSQSILANMQTYEANMPLRHPRGLERDIEADARTAQLFFGRSSTTLQPSRPQDNANLPVAATSLMTPIWRFIKRSRFALYLRQLYGLYSPNVRKRK